MHQAFDEGIFDFDKETIRLDASDQALENFARTRFHFLSFLESSEIVFRILGDFGAIVQMSDRSGNLRL